MNAPQRQIGLFDRIPPEELPPSFQKVSIDPSNSPTFENKKQQKRKRTMQNKQTLLETIASQKNVIKRMKIEYKKLAEQKQDAETACKDAENALAEAQSHIEKAKADRDHATKIQDHLAGQSDRLENEMMAWRHKATEFSALAGRAVARISDFRQKEDEQTTERLYLVCQELTQAAGFTTPNPPFYPLGTVQTEKKAGATIGELARAMQTNLARELRDVSELVTDLAITGHPIQQYDRSRIHDAIGDAYKEYLDAEKQTEAAK